MYRVDWTIYFSIDLANNLNLTLFIKAYIMFTLFLYLKRKFIWCIIMKCAQVQGTKITTSIMIVLTMIDAYGLVLGTKQNI